MTEKDHIVRWPMAIMPSEAASDFKIHCRMLSLGGDSAYLGMGVWSGVGWRWLHPDMGVWMGGEVGGGIEMPPKLQMPSGIYNGFLAIFNTSTCQRQVLLIVRQ